MLTVARRGFTLVEIAAVVAIVGIIAALAMMRMTDLVRSSEIALARDFHNQLKNGAEIYTARMG